MSQIEVSRVFAYEGVFFRVMGKVKNQVEIFKQHRQRLFGLAYRMLGTRDEAEDIVQETYLRWHKAEAEKIESAEAWLVSVATRLSIDRLRLLAKERETYIGPWLPEPLLTDENYTPEEQLEFADNLSLAFLTLLEKLSPVERAAFLLREVFEVSYTEIARVVGKNEAACRQLVHRAKERVRGNRQRFETTDEERKNLIEKFILATKTSDEKTLTEIFAADATLTSDGGGKALAARRIVEGGSKIVNLYANVAKKAQVPFESEIVRINGELGIVTTIFGQPVAATVFEIEGGKISRVYQVMNPDKLKSLGDGNIALT